MCKNIGKNTKRFMILLISTIIFIILAISINKLMIKLMYKKEYSEYVSKYSKEYEVDENLIYAIIKAESNFEAEAVSNKNAKGLMQLMYSTAEEIAIQNEISIIDVVSGHGIGDSNNFKTSDKIYLLSTAEILKDGASWGDSAINETRQLDYYINKVTKENYSAAYKYYGEEAYDWWLRTANKGDGRAESFLMLNMAYNSIFAGGSGYSFSNGISPAFRIG